MNEQIKNKVIKWCNQEGFNPETLSDPDARFNIEIEVSGFRLNIIQKVSPDSLFVVTKFTLTPEQYNRLENLEINKKQEFLWDLNFTLATNPGILEFNIGPNPPNQIREVIISSKPVFYDGLLKDTLMARVYDVFKAFFIAGWKVNRAIGIQSPSGPRTHMYT